MKHLSMRLSDAAICPKNDGDIWLVDCEESAPNLFSSSIILSIATTFSDSGVCASTTEFDGGTRGSCKSRLASSSPSLRLSQNVAMSVNEI